jgi:hypothetical protein
MTIAPNWNPPAESRDDTRITICDWGGVKVTERTRKTGSTRLSLEVQSDAVVVDLDAARLGQPVAEAIAEAIRGAIRGVAENATIATQLARKYAASAFARGESWARKRYSGGKIGPMAPNQSSNTLNDSGRLAKSVAARLNREGAYVINVAANRLNQEPARSRTLAKLREHVAILRDLAQLGSESIVRRAITQATEQALQSAGDAARARLAQALKEFYERSKALEQVTEVEQERPARQ